KNTPQGAGSLITYLKRYSLSAVFGITSDQDDDGNQSSGNNNKPKGDELTIEFSKAIQKLGSKAKVYEQLGTTQEEMFKLNKSKNTKGKQSMIKKLKELA